MIIKLEYWISRNGFKNHRIELCADGVFAKVEQFNRGGKILQFNANHVIRGIKKHIFIIVLSNPYPVKLLVSDFAQYLVSDFILLKN